MDTELDTTPLFTELGRALYVFQAIEVRIKFLLPHLSVPGTEEPPDGEGWGGRRKYLDSKEMLGNLIKLFQQRMSVERPELLEQAWREIVQGRNDVVHNFVLQPFASCGSREDYEHSLEFIRQRRLRALPLLQMLDTLLSGFVTALQLPPGFKGEVPVELLSRHSTSAA